MRTTTTQILFAALLVAFSATVSLAQAQQYLLDSVAQSIYSPGPERDVTATADGGAILRLLTDQGEVLWKMDQSGEPVWTKQYGIDSWHRAGMPDGGMIMSAYLGTQWSNDTTYARFQVVRVDALGEVVWSKLIRMHDYPAAEFQFFLHHLATDDAGRCLITNGSSIWSQGYQQFFYCMDADGNLLWSKTYLFDIAAGWTEYLSSDGMGGWYFGPYTQGQPIFRLGHLDGSGELTWYNSYQWNQPAGTFFWLSDLTTLEHAAVVAGHTDPIEDDDPRHSTLMRLNLDGSLNWIRSYYSDPGMQLRLDDLGRCEAMTSGELLVSSGAEGIRYDVIRMTGAGEVVSSFRSTALDVAGSTFDCWFSDWDVFDSTLIMGNYMILPWDSINPIEVRPAVWRLPIADVGGCSMEENEVYSMLLSNGNVTVIAHPYSEVLVPYTISDIPCSVTSLTPLAVSDYCNYVTGIPSLGAGCITWQGARQQARSGRADHGDGPFHALRAYRA